MLPTPQMQMRTDTAYKCISCGYTLTGCAVRSLPSYVLLSLSVQLKKKTLEVTVWDYDRSSSNDFLGEVSAFRTFELSDAFVFSFLLQLNDVSLICLP